MLFVTVCTDGRKPVLNSEPVHACLRAVWPQALQWRVGPYMIMPDHVHLFCVPGTIPCENVKRWTGYWKRLAARALPELAPLWQTDCWDTQMRERTHYNEKRAYVSMNPVRKGLVGAPEEWPFQGEMNTIRW